MLCELPRPLRYVALSYVWVHWPQLLLEELNRERLSTPSGPGPGNVSTPATIRDAMAVCKAHGQHYLWVDALCIVQDSETDKVAQIGAMDLVYRNADLTIVAVPATRTQGSLVSATHFHFTSRQP